jgi:twitching motility protein PilT
MHITPEKLVYRRIPMDLSQIIEAAVKLKASDIHLMENCPPYFRLDNAVLPVKHPPVSKEEMTDLLNTILPKRLSPELEKRRGVDIGYQYKDVVRCRVIVFFERQRLRVVMRLIPLEVPTIEQLELPDTLKAIADSRRGMVIVTGPTGSGKSTTLAAMIDYINSTHKMTITTIEDPIEYLHQNKKSVVTQREVGDDVTDFNTGLIQALRQDPDVILLGEMRDVESMRTAIKAAETGHLVFSTLHTTNAAQTVERVIANFPEPEHNLARAQLASNLKAVVTQYLVQRIEGKGRIAALEIMVVNSSIEKLIADNRIPDIAGVMRTGQEGMQVFDQALANLARDKKISEEDGARYAMDVYAYRRYVKGVQSSSDRGGIIAGF